MSSGLLTVAIATIAISASGETQTESARTESYSDTAYQKGRTDAENDIKNNRLALEIFGLPAPYYSEYTKLLRERYQVELRQVAGCVPDGQIIGHARGYDEIAMKEIEHRFGKDMLEEARKEAEKKFQTSRQH